MQLARYRTFALSGSRLLLPFRLVGHGPVGDHCDLDRIEPPDPASTLEELISEADSVRIAASVHEEGFSRAAALRATFTLDRGEWVSRNGAGLDRPSRETIPVKAVPD